MTQKKSPHIFSLCALFVLGNVIINNSFITVLVSALASLGLTLLSVPIIKKASQYKSILFFMYFVVIIVAIHATFDTVRDYLSFLSAVQMPLTNTFLLLSAFVVAIIVFSRVCHTAFYKYVLLVGVINGLFILICFFAGIKNFDFSHLYNSITKWNFSIREIVSTSIPTLIIPFFLFLSSENQISDLSISGIALGFIALLLCVAQSALTLGGVNDIIFPYLKAVSSISSGSLFTRLDGLVYFFYFTTALIKCSVCIKTIILIIKKLKCNN